MNSDKQCVNSDFCLLTVNPCEVTVHAQEKKKVEERNQLFYFSWCVSYHFTSPDGSEETWMSIVAMTCRSTQGVLDIDIYGCVWFP